MRFFIHSYLFAGVKYFDIYFNISKEKVVYGIEFVEIVLRLVNYMPSLEYLKGEISPVHNCRLSFLQQNQIQYFFSIHFIQIENNSKTVNLLFL